MSDSKITPKLTRQTNRPRPLLDPINYFSKELYELETFQQNNFHLWLYNFGIDQEKQVIFYNRQSSSHSIVLTDILYTRTDLEVGWEYMNDAEAKQQCILRLRELTRPAKKEVLLGININGIHCTNINGTPLNLFASEGTFDRNLLGVIFSYISP